jgi:hypothetical protein
MGGSGGASASTRESKGNVHAAPPLGSRRLPSAAQLKCSLDELVVGRYAAVGGEDHELEAGAEHLAIR